MNPYKELLRLSQDKSFLEAWHACDIDMPDIARLLTQPLFDLRPGFEAPPEWRTDLPHNPFDMAWYLFEEYIVWLHLQTHIDEDESESMAHGSLICSYFTHEQSNMWTIIAPVMCRVENGVLSFLIVNEGLMAVHAVCSGLVRGGAMKSVPCFPGTHLGAIERDRLVQPYHVSVENLTKAMAYINHPAHHVIAVDPKKRTKKARQAQRQKKPLTLQDRRRHIVVKREDVVNRYRSAHGLQTHEKTPHFRRGHHRTFRDERFTHKKGERIWIKPTKVGEPEIEWEDATLKYKVIS